MPRIIRSFEVDAGLEQVWLELCAHDNVPEYEAATVVKKFDGMDAGLFENLEAAESEFFNVCRAAGVSVRTIGKALGFWSCVLDAAASVPLEHLVADLRDGFANILPAPKDDARRLEEIRNQIGSDQQGYFSNSQLVAEHRGILERQLALPAPPPSEKS